MAATTAMGVLLSSKPSVESESQRPVQKFVQELRQIQGLKLIDDQHLLSKGTEHLGAPTGWGSLDKFVQSGGFPFGKITLVESKDGLGGSSLWLEAAAKQTDRGHHVAWINLRDSTLLNPVAAQARRVRLDRLLFVDGHKLKARQLFWAIREMLSTKLFSLIGCDLGDVHLPLREFRSLLAQARRSGAAVVFFTREGLTTLFQFNQIQLASLALRFNASHVDILRAVHRDAPRILPFHRRISYAGQLESHTLSRSLRLQGQS
jgi:recombination protein RecA